MYTAGFIVLVLLVMDLNSRMADLRRLSAERDRVSAHVTSLVETQVSLETQVAQASSEEAVLLWALTHERWGRPGEVLVVPIQQEGTAPTPVPTPVPTPEVIHNWQVWVSLFFDTAPADTK